MFNGTQVHSLVFCVEGGVVVRVGGVVSEVVGPAAAAVGAAKRCHGPSAVARLCLPVRHVVLPGWIHQLNSLVVFVLRCVCVCVCV